ncbi:2-phytyl-1,4-beta-naphthoquinone methyltransferase, chloroplastic [Tanacetum coccineum]
MDFIKWDRNFVRDVCTFLFAVVILFMGEVTIGGAIAFVSIYVVWVEGDALDLPFSDCHFDAITVVYGLRNVIDKYKAMKEIYRVLKPWSKASILDFNKSTGEFSTSIQVLNMLDRDGELETITNICYSASCTYGCREFDEKVQRAHMFLEGCSYVLTDLMRK